MIFHSLTFTKQTNKCVICTKADQGSFQVYTCPRSNTSTLLHNRLFSSMMYQGVNCLEINSGILSKQVDHKLVTVSK